jgi:subtilisin-like proprotein convertase family protein
MVAVAALGADDYNKRYGQTQFKKLPEKGCVSKTVWVGSWWSYKDDGIANRYLGEYETQKYTPVTDAAKNNLLSPAEKMDWYAGRKDKIEYDKIKTFIEKKAAVETEVDGWIEERRTLVYKLNDLIEEHSKDPAFKWEETEEGKKYKELGTKIDEKQKALAESTFTADTAYEWEVNEHGNSQFGVQYWWGHCNAWSAAAVMEPEPVKDAVVKDVPFNVGDVKGLLTEAWMECNSSFFGTRNERHSEAKDREKPDYLDITPANFHIFFADQIGIRDKSFVADMYAGSEVWNHPIKAYWSKCEPQYEVGADGKAKPEKKDPKLTDYGGWYGGKPQVTSLGERSVYPVLCTTTVHYMSDGVAPAELTEKYDFASMTYEKFTGYYSDHYLRRTLTYVLYLSAPMDSDDAAIVGDGEWNHGDLTKYGQIHPDFVWQPTANTNQSNRDYENPYVDYNALVKEILPATLAAADDPAVPATEFSSTAEVAIPDGGPENKMGTPVTSVITVGQSVTVEKMEVAVNIEHTYIGDLQVTLTSPAGKEEILKRVDEGGSEKNLDKTYDVKAFNGTDAKGDWTLTVVDGFEKDTGTLKSWSIKLK